MQTSLFLSVDADAIARVDLNALGRSKNYITADFQAELSRALDRITTDAAVRGVLISSSKDSFCSGFDLEVRTRQVQSGQTASEAYAANRALSLLYRRLELCGKPVAVAINGPAVGAGLELCLACHYRVMANDPAAELSLPDVIMGLSSCAGGTQRLPRLIGVQKSLSLLIEGRPLGSFEAHEYGLVNEIARPTDLVEAARRWLLTAPGEQQPWDRKGFCVPGGSNISAVHLGSTLMVATARIAANGAHHSPAPLAILSSIFEGLQVPIDVGLDIESKYFAQLLTGPVARNVVQTLYVNRQAADALRRRPIGIPKSHTQRLGIVGAGMMGAGIAYSAAVAGIMCVLVDTSDAQLERGRAHSVKLLRKEVARGRLTQPVADATLGRIVATTDYSQLSTCDLVIEAVFEDRAVKHDVIRRVEQNVSDAVILASNTSTLPINSLAGAARHPDRFIGLHFFSPVDRMPLVEVIIGERTSAAALARALDFVGQLQKTPIVVGDGRGFYTTRVFAVFCYEGQRMLEEGINPALIENAARMAGMPLGPLAVSDEVSLELQYQVIAQARRDLGERFVEPVAWNVLRHFVEDLGRLGRKSGGGFYDYPGDGPKRLWAGLAGEYARAPMQPGADDIGKRLLYIQSLESARCYEQGVLDSCAEADLGSVLGLGFPAHTGGTLSLIDTVGARSFVADCQRFTRLYGSRFRPTRRLLGCARQSVPYCRAMKAA